MNVGSADRWFRLALGLGLICLVFVGPRTMWGWIGVIPLATSLAGWCPLYRMMGWSTARPDAVHRRATR